MTKDPVCGMDVEEKDAVFMVHFEHETFYFCSRVCQEEFERKECIRHDEPDKKWWQKILKESKGVPPRCH